MQINPHFIYIYNFIRQLIKVYDINSNIQRFQSFNWFRLFIL